MRFAEFITEVVAKRKLPISAQVITPRVVIKVRQNTVTRYDMSCYVILCHVLLCHSMS